MKLNATTYFNNYAVERLDDFLRNEYDLELNYNILYDLLTPNERLTFNLGKYFEIDCLVSIIESYDQTGLIDYQSTYELGSSGVDFTSNNFTSVRMVITDNYNNFYNRGD